MTRTLRTLVVVSLFTVLAALAGCAGTRAGGSRTATGADAATDAARAPRADLDSRFPERIETASDRAAEPSPLLDGPLAGGGCLPGLDADCDLYAR